MSSVSDASDACAATSRAPAATPAAAFLNALGTPLLALLAALALLLLLAWVVPARIPAVSDANGLKALYLALDAVPIAISVLIFAIGWSADIQDVPRSSLMLSIAFAGVALLDLGHVLSSPSMAGLILEQNADREITFWVAARLLAGLGLLGGALLGPKPLERAGQRHLLLGAVAAGTMAAGATALMLPSPALQAVGPSSGGGWSALIMGCAAVAAYLGAAFALSHALRKNPRADNRMLFAATAVSGFGMLLWIVPDRSSRVQMLLCHAYSVVAFLLIYRAVFHRLVSTPYLRLRHAQRATAESEAKFQSVLALSSDWYWEQDEQYRTTYMSPRYSARNDLAMKPTLGQTRFETDNIWESEEQKRDHKAALDARLPFHDLRLSRYDEIGNLRYFSINGQPVFSAGGKFVGYRGTGRDITAQRSAEIALNARESLLKATFEQAAAGMALVTLDGRFLQVNDRLCTMLGYTRAELIRLCVRDVAHPDEHSTIVRSYGRLSRGEIVSDAMEKRCKTKSGEFIWASVSRAAVRNTLGEAEHVVVVCVDITALKLAEQALKENEERFRSLLHLSTDWYWEQDEEFRFTSVSAAPEWPAEPLGKTRWELPYVGVSPQTWKRHKVDLRARKPFFDLEFAAPDGRGGLRYVSVSGEPIFDGEGNFKGYRGITKDVTRRRLAELEREHSEKLARSMLDGLAASVCIIDERASIVAVNKAWERYYEQTDGAPSLISIGASYLEICRRTAGDSYADAMAVGIAQVLSGSRHEFVLEYPCDTPMAKRWFVAKVVGIPGAEPLKAVVSHDDITPIKRAQELLAIENRVLAMLAASARLPEVLETLCERFERLSDGARYAVWMADRDGSHIKKGAASSLPAAYIEAVDGALIESCPDSAARAIGRREPVFTEDIFVDPGWEPLRVAAGRLRACWALPIMSDDGGIHGAVAAYFPDARTPDDVGHQLLERAAHLVGIAIDRARAEERRLLTVEVFKSSQAGIMITDAQKNILLVNRAFTEITGYSAAEARGMHPRMLSSGVQDEDFYRGMWNSIHNRGYWRGELWDRRKSGDLFCEHLSVGAVKNQFGEVTHYVAIFAEITERKRAEEALRASETLLRLITANVPAMIGYYDADLRCQFANQRHAETFGLKPGDMIGRFLTEFVGAALFADMAPHFAEVMTGVQVRFENEILSPTGEVRFHEVSLVPDVGDDGAVLGCYALASDVTDKRLAEQQTKRMNAELEKRVEKRTRQLAAANKELEAFSYSVSHDLRAPLRSIEGFGRILAKKYAGKLDDTARDHLQRIERATQRMGELIDDMLELSRISHAEMRRSSVNVSELSRNILIELTAGGHRRRKPELLVDDGLVLEADARLLRIALENLLGNALKFIAKTPAPRIEVRRFADGARAGILVRDNGAGFDMQYVNKLFGAFQRLHRNSEFEGTGIGLAIVQRIVNLHGWSIRAEGEIGKGATFYLTVNEA